MPVGGFQVMVEIKCKTVYIEKISEFRIWYEVRVKFYLFRVLLTSLSTWHKTNPGSKTGRFLRDQNNKPISFLLRFLTLSERRLHSFSPLGLHVMFLHCIILHNSSNRFVRSFRPQVIKKKRNCLSRNDTILRRETTPSKKWEVKILKV